MRTRLLYIVSFILLLPFFTFGNGVNDSLYFKVINMKDGLPGSTIMDFEQDSLGFIWIATNDGLCRYDGTNFKVFRHEPNNDNSLWNNNIQSLFIDSKHNLWVMTSNGLNQVNLKQKVISRIKVGLQSGGLLDNSPTDIVETKEGTLFISSYYSGVSFKRNNENSYQYLNDLSTSGASLSSTNVNALGLLLDSLLVIAYRDAGIDIYNTVLKQSSSLEEISGNQLCSQNVKVICNSKNGGLWIGTDKGLSYYNAIDKTLLNFPFIARDGSFIVDREILSLFVDDNDYLWIGTRKNGLVIVEENEVLTKGKEALYTQYLPKQKAGDLSYRTVLNIFKDRNNQIWIGTHGGGINLVESKHNRFGHLYHSGETKRDLSYNKVWGITEDLNGNIWLGTDGDGINVWNNKNGVIQNFRKNDKETNSLSDNAIISALTDSKGRIWLGTYEGGLNRFDPAKKNFRIYEAPGSLPVNDIRCIYEDNEGTIWIGMNRSGIARYNESIDKFEVLEQTTMYDVRSIYKNGWNIWLGTYSFGLVKLNEQSGEIANFNMLSSTDSVAQIQTIYSIYSNHGEKLWLGTDNAGLAHFNTNSEELTLFSEKNGLSNNKVHAILPDNYSNLWLSTNKGISRFNIEEEVFFNYDWRQGVQPQEFHDGSSLITKSGIFCFGGINGMNYFKPENFLGIRKKPNLQFTSFSVMNSEILAHQDKIIDKSIEYGPDIQLTHKHRFFSLEFQSLNYPLSGDIHYDYILEGYDKEWIEAGKKNRAVYKNISSGNYTFKVRSYQKNSEEIYEQIQLNIYVSPPIWKRTWAYFLYVIGLGILTYLIFKNRVKQYEYKNQIVYEKKLREKQQKLHEERLEFFTNISHELRTPLTIIGVALEELLPIKRIQPKLKKTYDTAVKNSDRLMELINKLMAFRRAEKGISRLAIEKLDLNIYLPQFLQDYRQMAGQNNINLKLSLPMKDLSLWVDPDKFTMILNNLMSNAFKNTPNGGSIVLSADGNSSNIIIELEDTGSGIDKKNLKKIFDRYYKTEHKSTDTGIGLALTKSLVELHKGTTEVISVPKKGSKFTITFLKGKEHFLSDQLSKSEHLNDRLSNDTEWLGDDQIMLSNKHQILLLIDDNVEILDLLQDKFIKDFKIIKSLSGEEGVELARKFSPDLIISDIMMPGITGIEVCQQLKNDPSTSHIPIILLTAKASEKDEIEGLSTGADDYISKPFKLSILRARVNSILENRKKIVGYFGSKSESLQKEDQIDDREMIFLNKLKAYVLSNCLDENVSVFKIASDFGFSRTSLYRKVKSLTGMSINAFVRSVKIIKSAELIQEGMNVSEAAYSVGFEDLKYFRECFKKQIGKNPSDLK